MQSFRQFIENYTPIPDEEWSIVSAAFQKHEFKKNELILREGEICRYFGFLEKGLLRFFVHKNGEDVTKFFTVAPYCFTSQYSFRQRVPAAENIETLEPCTAYLIGLDKADELLSLKHWADFTRKFVQEVQFHTEQLMMEAKTEDAGKRYLNLIEKYPQLIQRIPLRHLSSFLGIAPQSLSRIRKDFLKHSKKLT